MGCATFLLLMATVSAWAGASYHLTELTLGSFSTGAAINDSGQVAGTSTTPDGEPHAFLWDGAVMQDLGALGGTSSNGFAINATGQVTGHFIRFPTSPTRSSGMVR